MITDQHGHPLDSQATRHDGMNTANDSSPSIPSVLIRSICTAGSWYGRRLPDIDMHTKGTNGCCGTTLTTTLCAHVATHTSV